MKNTLNTLSLTNDVDTLNDHCLETLYHQNFHQMVYQFISACAVDLIISMEEFED